MTTALDSVARLTEALRAGRLLEPAQLDELTASLAAHFPEPRALARELVRRGWLTPDARTCFAEERTLA